MRITGVTPIVCHGGFRNWTFVKVTTDRGITGWGDASEWMRPLGRVKIIEEDLAPLVIGEDPFQIERLWQKVWVASYVGGMDLSVAFTGIETALWDIVGKAHGVPVSSLLGGTCHDRIRLYFDFCDAYGDGFRGPNLWAEGDTSLEGVARQARWIQEQRFTALKTHPIGLAPRPSVTRTAPLKAVEETALKIRTIREHAGRDVDIILDLNNRLDLPSSIAMAKALEPYHLLFLEDPIRQDEGPGSYRRLAQAVSTPVGTGENLYTVWDFRAYLESGAITVALPDICHTGVLQARKIAALAEAYHVPIAPHNPNSPLATIISGTICATIPNFLALEFISDSWEPPWRDTVMTPPLSDFVRDGHLDLPPGPGWGVEIDEEEAARHPYISTWYWWQQRMGDAGVRLGAGRAP